MSRYDFSWQIGGEAGFGIKSAGLIFAKVINRAGFEAFGYVEYPSIIRGGHNTYQVTVGVDDVRGSSTSIDILVALNDDTVVRHASNLNSGGIVIFDSDTIHPSRVRELKARNAHLVGVPLTATARKVGGFLVMRNTVALGATHAVLGLPFSLLAGVIKHTLGHKSHVLKNNLTVAKIGYDFVKKNYPQLQLALPKTQPGNTNDLLIEGNEALALGALAGGLQFYAAYPMTPSSTILHYLAEKASSERLIVKHAEDEISVINMAIGASHAGARSMIGTSGGGFALMVEALGLAGITETPLVIVEAQRPGPATGLPTWTEQSDLRFVMHAAQGEFPRIVLAPGDHEECFYLAGDALNLADQYQIPVIILTDKFLAESDRTVAPFDASRITINRGKAIGAGNKKQGQFKRYRLTPSGVSPRSVPGEPYGVHLANSDEHDEYGFSNEDSAMRIAQVDKRMRKLDFIEEKMSGVTYYGHHKPKVLLVGWGSTKGPLRDSLLFLPERLRQKAGLLHIHRLLPFPAKEVAHFLRRAKKTLLVENNATAQLGGIIRQETGISIAHKYLRYDGRPMYAQDIAEKIKDL